MKTGKCKACGAPVRWVQTKNQKWMPCHPAPVYYWPDPEGPDKVLTGAGEVVACRLDGKLDKDTPAGYKPHWGECPKADRLRRAQKDKEAGYVQISIPGA